MNKFTLALVCVASLSLSGCGSTGALPSSAQITAEIPTALRKCPGIPAAPATPTNRATARYIVQLYNAALACKRSNTAVASLLSQYDAEIRKYKNALKGAQ